MTGCDLFTNYVYQHMIWTLTTCYLHVHHMLSTCLPHAIYMFTTCKPHLHVYHMQTTFLPTDVWHRYAFLSEQIKSTHCPGKSGSFIILPHWFAPCIHGINKVNICYNVTWSREMRRLLKNSILIFLHHFIISSKCFIWCKPHYNWISD